MVTHSHRAYACSTRALVLALLLATHCPRPTRADGDVPRDAPPPDYFFFGGQPPTDYEAADAPPPPIVAEVGLLRPSEDGDWAPGQDQGIVRLFSPQLGEGGGWGALCVDPRYVLDPQYDDKYNTMAKIICRQLGQPQRYARLLPASTWLTPPNAGLLPAVRAPPELPSAAVVTDGRSPCATAPVAATVTDCEGVLLQPTELQCGALEWGGKEQAAVVCAGSLPPAPPSPPSPPPRAPPARLTTRLVQPLTGLPVPGLSRGRLEVLPPHGGSWGTVCGADPQGVSTALAQYACLQAGQPGWRDAAFFQPSPTAPPLPLPASVPVWLVAARECEVVVAVEEEDEEGGGGPRPGLDCGLLAGPGYNPQLFLPGGGLDEAARLALLELSSRCALTQPGNDKHQLDVFVECPAPPEPSLPSWPPAAPQVSYNHGVFVRANEVLPNIYELAFVYQEAEEPMSGTVCSRNDDNNGRFSMATKMTLCANITGGARPYGSTAPASLDLAYPFLAPLEARRSRPVLLNAFECHDGHSADYDALPDLSYCQANLSRPVGRPLYKKCWNSGWASTLLVCSDQYSDIDPAVVGSRLSGGPDPSTGRLEVLLRNDLQWGWGGVCDDGSFTREHAQAVCRDLGLEWGGATLLPASSFPSSSPSSSSPPLVLMGGLHCESSVVVTQGSVSGSWSGSGQPPLSFVRDCARSPDFLVGDCPPEQHVVISCQPPAPNLPPSPGRPPLVPGFASHGPMQLPAQPPHPPPPAPPYASPPAPYGGYYGGRHPPATPSYQPIPPNYSLPPQPPPPPPPPPCFTYGGHYGGYGCHHGGGGGGYGGYGGYGGKDFDTTKHEVYEDHPGIYVDPFDLFAE